VLWRLASEIVKVQDASRSREVNIEDPRIDPETRFQVHIEESEMLASAHSGATRDPKGRLLATRPAPGVAEPDLTPADRDVRPALYVA
jgi:hypothetical protein